MTATLSQANKFKLPDYLIAALILGVVLVESPETVQKIGPSWDEPVYFHSVKNYAAWFKSIGQGNAFNRYTLESVFDLGLLTDCSPTLPKLLATITYSTFKNQLGEFRAFRAYAPILFGILLALIYLRVTSRWGRMAGIASVICVFFMPRVFNDGHIGATETPLCFFWFLTAILFEASFKRRWLMPLAGISYGLAMSVKFTGFVLPIPLLAWAWIYHRKKMFYPTLFLFLIGPLVFFLLEPSMWDDPIVDLLEFVRISAFRQGKVLVPVLFLGRYYEFSAPFYYAPFMVLVTTPVLTLFLFLLGLIRTALNRFQDQLAISLIIHSSFFILMMMTPNAPNYDGVRLFLPALIFLGILSGYGFAGVTERLEQILGRLKINHRLTRISSLVILLIVSAYPLLKVYPYGLEYYNQLIGGVAGARHHGMETTYWWTVVNPDALKRINRALPSNASLVCWPTRANICELYQELGLLRKDLKITKRKDFDYLLVLSRPYWNFQPFFAFLGIPQSELEIIASQELDGVPLWVLYRQPK